MVVTWTGTKELDKKLKRILRRTPALKKQFLAQEGEKLISRAKRKTPVDTGNLRRNWQRGEVEGDSVDVYNNTEYAAHVEFGHRTRGGVGFVPGQFFLRDAVQELEENFPADCQRFIAQVMDS